MNESDRNSRQSGEHPAAVPPRDTLGCTVVLLALAFLALLAIVAASAWVTLRGAP